MTYSSWENQDGSPLVLTALIMCETCGSMVLDQKIHDEWHLKVG